MERIVPSNYSVRKNAAWLPVTVQLVVDPHAQRVVAVENDHGECIGQATPLDALANATRRRRTPTPATPPAAASGPNLVELAYRQYHGLREQ